MEQTLDYIIDDVEWPGWPYNFTSYGCEFDRAARIRMIDGGKLLLDYLRLYREKLGTILEVGPFFNPLTAHLNIKEEQVVFWENDPHAFKWINTKFLNYKNVIPICCDVNKICHSYSLEEALPAYLSSHLKLSDYAFNSIVASQILNYIDYEKFFNLAYKITKPSGLLFINNVVNYGIPNFFISKRPKSIDETLEALEKSGFLIIMSAILPPPKQGEDNRLIAVAQKL
jgi:hypothetical protein